MFTSFVRRNPKFCIMNVGKIYSVRKAMKEYKQKNPCCEYCGRRKMVDVHHIQSVKDRPDLAGVSSNFLSLCRKPQCHLIVGHFGNWKTINPNSRQICQLKN